MALSGATLDNIDVSGFEVGVHVEDWVRGMHFHHSKITGNKRDVLVQGATEPPVDVSFDPPLKKRRGFPRLFG